MMAFTVAIGAGHGGFGVTPGKRTPDGEYEWNFNNKIVVSAIKHLKHNGFEIIRLDDPTGKTDVALSTRASKGKNADIYVSCHNNANAGKWFDGGGTETFYYEGSAGSKKLATLIHNQTVNVLKRTNRGVKKGNHLYEIRETKPVSCLLEALFMDSRQDIVLLRNDAKLAEVGKAVARGICEYFNVSFKDIDTVKPAPAPTGKTLHRVQTGAFSVKANADKLEAELKGKGYATLVVKEGSLYKVQVGAFSVLTNAKALSDKLLKDGYKNFIVSN